MTCIYINDPNHLYLTEQYIPTHNTTLVKSLIEALPNVNPDEDVVYTSFTGKAVNVLRQKEILMFLLYINFYISTK